MFKYFMITPDPVALSIIIGVLIERFSVQPQDSPKKCVVFIQYHYIEKN